MPEDAPQMPGLTLGTLRQFIMLPILWGSGKIDFKEPNNLQILQIVFTCMIGISYIAIQMAINKAHKANDKSRVMDPGASSHLSDDDKAADGSVSACAYDLAKLKEAKTQLVMSSAISSFIHMYFGWTQPLLVMSVTQPLTVFDNNALKIHMFGAQIERPWKAANADNPLAQWAERKQAEAAEANSVTDTAAAKKDD
mmetsp:Transcript_4661/g.12413  ORF Transcript_4661/g.12413 Transcript_4661/m.12413 type:complete len:197 (+) Transcript_4661:103-693(+)|eukprot:CAMPEP_0115865856 /NCGR_PEP_ID=MMETSP0287-20121206/19938_1 /TAXON_ID=412157 /ORGANISM="Chrysochromulina rotalis, Strain UIO044" /LENGTH=196 /DNA_ID=CAMNT_0003320383 /DNA_START=86 /DNA_END=676 /DNA_ORIENTATION=+